MTRTRGATRRDDGRAAPGGFLRSDVREWTILGVDGKTGFCALLRTAVRNLEAAGVSRSVAMELTCHRTESVYARYAIADSRSLAEGVGKLAQLHARQTDEAPKVVPIREAQR